MTILLATLGMLMINLFRVEQGLPEVPVDQTVCWYAEQRLVETKTDFTHRQFYTEKYSRKPGIWYENLGRIKGKYYLFNVTQIVKDWKESKPHRKNLLVKMDSMCIRTDGNNFVFIGYGK